MHPIEHLRHIARADGAPQSSLVEETAHALSGVAGDPAGLVTATRRIVSRHPSAGGLWNLCAHLLCANEPLDAASEFVRSGRSDQTAEHLTREIAHDVAILTVGWAPLLAPFLDARRDLLCWTVDSFGDGAEFSRALQRYDIEVSEFDPSGLGSVISEVDSVILEAAAYCESGALCSAGSLAAAAVANARGIPVVLAVGAGRGVAPGVFEAMSVQLDQAFEDTGNEPWAKPIESVPAELITTVVGTDGTFGVSRLSVSDGPVAPELFARPIN